MDNESIKMILNSLRFGSRNQIINNLIKIREQMIATDAEIKRLMSLGSVPLLLTLIAKPNENILDISLSILGNCCMVRDFAVEFVRLKGIPQTVNILRNINKDSILCRGCRLVGNIAQYEENVDQLHEYGVIEVLCSILNSSSDDALGPQTSLGTECMAVRALRLLWTKSIQRQLMLAHNVAKIVSMLMIRRSKNCDDNKQIKDLLVGIIRCLLHFSEHPSRELAQQILADGNGYTCLVKLIPLQPYMTVKCISNLLCVATIRSQFATEIVVDTLIKRLSESTMDNPKKCWPKDELSALCLMCKHTGVRQEIRDNSGLPLLLSVIQNCTDEKQKEQVLQTLLCFLYDETSLQALISSGLVLILVQYFEISLKSKTIQHDFVTSGKRSTDLMLNIHVTRNRSKIFRNAKIEEAINSLNEEKAGKSDLQSSSNSRGKKRTPVSPVCDLASKRWCFDSNPSSPNPDTRLSPQPMNHSPQHSSPLQDMSDSDVDSDMHYSPVCTDSESDKEDNNCDPPDTASVSFESLVNDDFLHYEMDDGDLANAIKEELSPKTGESRVIGCILLLLSRVSYMNEFVSELAEMKTINVLLHYMKLTSCPLGRAATLLVRIVSCYKSFNVLLLNDFPIMLHELVSTLPHNSQCKQCEKLKRFAQIVFKKLSQLTETFGRGEIEHCLYYSKDDTKQKIVISIPHIVQSKGLLRTFFGNFSALPILLNIISDSSLSNWPRAVSSLGILAIKLKIKNPKDNETFPSVRHIECNYKLDTQDKEIILFKLDDSTIVQADKNLLADKSEFFKALLTGKFKESTEKIIRLKNITNNGLKYLLMLIEYNELDTEEDFPLCVSLPIALEVLMLSDRYLFEKLTDKLSRAILKYKLSPETTSDVYSWSIESGTDILRVEALAFALVGSMTDQQRINLFKNIVDDGYTKQLLDDTKSLLQRYLKLGL